MHFAWLLVSSKPNRPPKEEACHMSLNRLEPLARTCMPISSHRQISYGTFISTARRLRNLQEFLSHRCFWLSDASGNVLLPGLVQAVPLHTVATKTLIASPTFSHIVAIGTRFVLITSTVPPPSFKLRLESGTATACPAQPLRRYSTHTGIPSGLWAFRQRKS